MKESLREELGNILRNRIDKIIQAFEAKNIKLSDYEASVIRTEMRNSQADSLRAIERSNR